MSEQNLLSLIDILDRWKKTILLFTLIAAVGSVFVSLSLTDYFNSSTLFYAASQDLSKPEKILGADEIQYYGNEDDIDRIIAIGNSNRLVDYIIDSFQLYEHYEIDRDEKLALFKVRKTFRRMYEILKTKYGAIELSVEDEDPEFAAKVANVARNKINELAQNVLKDGQQQMISFHQSSIGEKARMIRLLSDSLSVLRDQFGIYDVEAQNEVFSTLSAEVSTEYAKENAKLKSLKNAKTIPSDTLAYQVALVAGLYKQNEVLSEQLSQFNKGKNVIQSIEEQIDRLNETISFDRIRENQLQTAAHTDPKALHLIELAEPPLRKSRPKRSILVLAATMLTFVCTTLAVLVLERFRSLSSNRV